jgi:HlyD family secretion protein
LFCQPSLKEYCHMAVATQPARLGAAQRQSRQRRRNLIIGAATLAAVAVGGWLLWNAGNNSETAAAVSYAPIEIGTLNVSVAGSGSVEARQSRTLSFGVNGTVSAVRVGVGQRVSTGDVLAGLDTRELELALRQAAASLEAAEANLQSARGQTSDPVALANARAQYDTAVAQYTQATQGDATAAQLAQAEATLASARAQLDDLLAGPTEQELFTSQAAVEAARGNLIRQRTALAAARIKAENNVTTAANSLVDVQQDFSDVYWANQTTLQRRELNDNELTAQQAAQRAVENAEIALQNAQLSLEQAQRDEQIGVQQAESDLRSAELALQTLTAGPTTATLAQARSSVASAEAGLQALINPATANDRVIAEANLTQARLNFEALSTPADTATLANAEAAYLQAQVSYEQAQLNLTEAVLTAPFDGVVAAVDAAVGDTAAAASISLIDTSSYAIELSLSESDVTAVAVGQAVKLEFDALPDLQVEGTVETVAPAAAVVQNVATYPVRVVFTAPDSALRAGMSAAGTISTAVNDNALLVPTRALVTTPGGTVLTVRKADGSEQRIAVQTGLAAAGKTEILACLPAGDMCLQQGDEVVVQSAVSGGNPATFGPGSGMGPGSGGFTAGGRP